MKKKLGILGFILCCAALLSAQSAYDLYEKGLDAMGLENFREARKSFDKAIALEPENDEFYLARGELMLMQNKHTFNKVSSENSKFYTDALKDFEKVIELEPASFEGWYGRARLKYMFLKFRDSQEDYDGALKAAYLTEDKVLALGGRGACQYRLGEVDGAMNDLERALDYDPTNPIILNELALIHIHQGETALAIKSLNTILKHHPDDPIALANMGFTALKAGKFERALNIYNEVIALTDDNAYLLSNRSFCLLNLNRFDEALKDINSSIAMNGKNSYAYKNRSLVYLALEDQEMACEDLKIAKDMGFTLAYGNEVLELLKDNCLSTNRSPSKTKNK